MLLGVVGGGPGADITTPRPDQRGAEHLVVNESANIDASEQYARKSMGRRQFRLLGFPEWHISADVKHGAALSPIKLEYAKTVVNGEAIGRKNSYAPPRKISPGGVGAPRRGTALLTHTRYPAPSRALPLYPDISLLELRKLTRYIAPRSAELYRKYGVSVGRGRTPYVCPLRVYAALSGISRSSRATTTTDRLSEDFDAVRRAICGAGAPKVRYFTDAPMRSQAVATSSRKFPHLEVGPQTPGDNARSEIVPHI